MNNTIVHQLGRMRIYWYSWLIILAFALVLRFTIFLGASSNRLFALASTYAIGTWLPIMVLNVIRGRKLSCYLRTHHREKWESLSYVPYFGSGMHNGFRTWPWLYSS